MSIDIFGRQSETKSSKTGRRGPPGPGFKITDDGQFNIDNKRLCNLADPENSSDAIPLRSAQNIIQHKVQSLNEGSLLMRQDIDIIIHGLEAKFDDYRKNQRIENENTIEVISKLGTKVTALEKNLGVGWPCGPAPKLPAVFDLKELENISVDIFSSSSSSKML